MARRKPPRPVEAFAPTDPYREMWLSLTPAQRLRRAWRLRRRLKNIQAIHDAKTFPEL
jgi:hypothetical protein